MRFSFFTDYNKEWIDFKKWKEFEITLPSINIDFYDGFDFGIFGGEIRLFGITLFRFQIHFDGTFYSNFTLLGLYFNLESKGEKYENKNRNKSV